MWPSLRNGAIISMLGLCVAAAAGLRDGERRVSDLAGDLAGDLTGDLAGNLAGDVASDDTTGGLGNSARAGLRLSDEERFRIYESVMRIEDAPVADVPPPEVADALPHEVAMQDLPASVVNEVPRVNEHKFVKLDDRILVVEPASRLVVAMIPRYKLLP
ncbi:MAG: hypothetical protein IT537_24095 [Hyphomicrobiales bacterium]|nr:hypothetical protein [Hyphomicrobiales bacterium]